MLLPAEVAQAVDRVVVLVRKRNAGVDWNPLEDERLTVLWSWPSGRGACWGGSESPRRIVAVCCFELLVK